MSREDLPGDSSAPTGASARKLSGRPELAEDLVTVRRFGTPQEAAVAQGFLETHGIPSFIQGSQTATVLSYFGTAVGDVLLQVPFSSAKRAGELLKNEFDRASEIPAWRCPACGAAVDAGFAVCWSCGNSYAPSSLVAESKPPAGETLPPQETEPSVPSAEVPAAGKPSRIEDFIDRAWKAAVLGIVLVPLELYALFVLLKRPPGKIPSSVALKYYGTMLLIVLVLFLWFAFLFPLHWFIPDDGVSPTHPWFRFPEWLSPSED